MKRLFALKFANGQLALDADGKPMFFANKMDAKKRRDELNAGYTVSIGPDHHGKTASHYRRSRKRNLRGCR